MVGQGGSAFGITLMELMKKRNDIIVLSADMSTPAGLDKFKAAYPERFRNVGIAEQNMIGIAAGLAEEGYKVICVAQACFITMRCFEQVRQFVGYMGIPIILVGIGSGVSLQYMGNTHYALEDIALMRTVHGMNVIAPCDALEAEKVLESAIQADGASYIRLFGGTGIPAVHFENFAFEIGKAISLREGKDVSIVATGSMVKQSIQAAEILSGDGIECSVIDVHTIKPFDMSVLNWMSSSKLVVTVEEHRFTGGLGSVVAEIMLEKEINNKLLKLGVGDNYLLPGSYRYMLDETGLSAEKIAQRIKDEIISLAIND